VGEPALKARETGNGPTNPNPPKNPPNLSGSLWQGWFSKKQLRAGGADICWWPANSRVRGGEGCGRGWANGNPKKTFVNAGKYYKEKEEQGIGSKLAAKGAPKKKS